MTTPDHDAVAAAGCGGDELRRTALAAGSGDRAALTTFIRLTSPTVWRICAGLVDPASADDLTQETYVRALTTLRGYRGDASPIRWLVTIVRRVCADEVTVRHRGRRLAERLRPHAAPGSGDPFTAAAVNDALSRLSRPRREAFVLTAVAGLSYEDAAVACGCAVGTIRSRVSRARTDLRRSLTAHDPPGRPRRTAARRPPLAWDRSGSAGTTTVRPTTTTETAAGHNDTTDPGGPA